jgi:signal transduction histidine kinase
MLGVVSSVCVLNLLGLGALWRRRPHAVLDLWLMVVMCVWFFDVALSAVLNGGRYDLGFYGGRIYGLVASSFVLVMLLIENTVLYSRLAEAHFRHGRRLAILHEIDRAVAAEKSPETIAKAVIQPLRELLGVPRAIVNIFDLEAGLVEWLAAAGRRRTHVGPGVRYSLELMGDVERLKRGEPQIVDTHALAPGPERDALLASGVELYMAVPMIAGGELIGAISFGDKPGPFPAEQVTIAREVATQLAIALTLARLYERVKRQAEELDRRVRERTAELQAANDELEAFSYSVSHDLRAPLRAMDGFTGMLESDHAARLDADGRRLLARVRANSRRMGQLIDDLLAFSRLTRQPLSVRPVALAELTNEVIRELQPDYDGREIDFALGELGLVDADQALLRQALVNLLSNAIKFTRRTDAARVEIGCLAEAQGGDKTFYVKDNGAGFDMRYAEKLFGVFQRLHHVDEYEGTGVGLAIVRRVIQRHGGTVWADAKPGEGATFFFTLRAPAAGSDKDAAQARN